MPLGTYINYYGKKVEITLFFVDNYLENFP